MNESTEKKRLARLEAKKKKVVVEEVSECELSIAFQQYLKNKLAEHRQAKLQAEREARRIEEREKKEKARAMRKAGQNNTGGKI